MAPNEIDAMDVVIEMHTLQGENDVNDLNQRHATPIANALG